MGCTNPDGTLTSTAKAILKLLQTPLRQEELSAHLAMPLFKVQSTLKELAAAGLIEEIDERYVSTGKGKAKIQE